MIIIRISDPDGSIFRRIMGVLHSEDVEVVDIKSSKNTELSFPGLIIQINTGIVLRDYKEIQLNYGEFAALCCLARYPKHIFSKDRLYSAVYGQDHYNSNTIPNTICKLRSKIEPDPRHPTYIKTVVGMGYKFDPPKG